MNNVNERKTMAEIGSTEVPKTKEKQQISQKYSLHSFARHNAIKGDEKVIRKQRENLRVRKARKFN